MVTQSSITERTSAKPDLIGMFAEPDWLAYVAKAYAVFLVIYFPMMTNIPLTIDAELNATSSSAIGWLIQGRWTTYFLTLIMFRPVVPYFTIAVFGLCATIAYTILLAGCGVRRDVKTLAAFSVFIGFPVWSTLLEFPANTVAAGVALLLCMVAAAMLADRPVRPPLLIGQIIAVALAVGAYQSFIFIYIAAGFAVVFFREKNSREIFKYTAIICVISLFSIALHFIVQEFLFLYLGLSQAYIGVFFHPHLIISDPIAVFLRSFDIIYKIYSGDELLFGYYIFSTPLLIVLALVSAWCLSLLRGVLIIGVLLTPFPLLLVSGGWLPVRTLIAAPVAIGICSLVLVESKRRIVRCTGVVFSVILALQSVGAISQYQAARDLTTKFDHATAAEIYYKVHSVSGEDGPKTVDFFGSLQPPQLYPIIPSSTAGASFFSWDGGNPWRMLTYMKMLGFSDLNLPSVETRHALKGEYAEMPKWPAPGSVRKVGDIILVKLGDQPGHY